MFDESFFVALAFATVIAAFLYLKLPQRLLAALDAKSAEIANELDEARRLREEAEALLADYETRRKSAEQQAEEIVTEARETAQRLAEEARVSMQAQLERRTQQAETKSPAPKSNWSARCAQPFRDWPWMPPPISLRQA